MAPALQDNGSDVGVHRLQLALDGFSVASKLNELQTHDEKVRRHPCYPVELSIWHQVNSELESPTNIHQRFWWSRHSGKVLAVLLHYARHPPELQYRDLKFFAEVVAPYLGVSHEAGVVGGTSPWPSFVTDDGTPVELSWDWGTRDSLPTIRYAIEPIGLRAGTSLDPHNLAVGPAFQDQLARSLPEMGLELFRHFISFFNGHVNPERGAKGDDGDRPSSIFYAFDLAAEITAKVYFFPKMRATAFGQSNLEVIMQAIHTTPGVSNEDLEAFAVFRDFASDPVNIGLEYEMLATDLISLTKSRFKIYLRCRDTSFNSVINIMTLGGRIRRSNLYSGLVDIHQLWKGLFGARPLDQPLGHKTHRTAGMIYNVEFRLGDTVPVTKIYLPVRHYSSSDAAVIQGLNDYFQDRQRGKYMPDYVKAMSTLS
ncbi:hypothetical protein INS49_004899 [Diaporthe citri]|uniref:uncharacterized protein n=1 Tax=Diaporthe citri TaxID=83186 RepID=UPI001C7ED651|nr:uncharacterized protein INS49_004899 [Diaporthe citri]KAG6354294.1 hypothetical protein INS49_004899 [Diaporthe citri]